MLAKLHVFLPFELTLPDGVEYQLYSFESDGYRVQFGIPMRSDRPPALGQSAEVTINGKPGIQADAFAITFQKHSFDRGIYSATDPPEVLIKSALDYFFGRFRYVANAHQVRAPSFPQCQWQLQYLNDDGSELEASPDRLRRRFSRKWSVALLACDPGIWKCIFSLPADFEPPAWHTLLLDSRSALPHVGTAVVLAATALEVFIAELLGVLVKDSHVPNELWDWINDRDDDFSRQPSVAERFDRLLKVMTGHSLKEEDALWQAFQKLKNARNKFVHEGVPRIGNSATPVSEADALALIGQANAIVAKIREWIPEAKRWPLYTPTSEMQFRMPLFPEQTEEAAPVKVLPPSID
jgi:hypothetical protein